MAERGKVQAECSLILFSLESEGGLESPVFLALIFYLLAVVEHHLVDLAPLERGEDVVLVGLHKLVGGRHDVVGG